MTTHRTEKYTRQLSQDERFAQMMRRLTEAPWLLPAVLEIVETLAAEQIRRQ